MACGPDGSSTEDGVAVVEVNAPATPSSELASAETDIGEEQRPDRMARNGAATAYGAASTDVPVGSAGGGSSSGGSTSGGPVNPFPGAGPKPTATCTVSKDAAGFFTRSSAKSSYVAYVPASYDGSKPVRLIVGLHGCGDSAMNFATWGVNPYDTRKTQEHIGISIGGKDGNCWSLGTDDDKVLAAVDDISQCFWVHQKKVAIAGFSSGGQLAYRVGLKHASRFAAILIEGSGLYAADSNPDALLSGAAWKLHIAHRTHTSDTVFPLAKVKADWTKTTAAGFPLLTSETPGGHDGVSADWSTWLIPQSATWTAP
jgi:dienelactone hydrolase